MEIRTKIKTKVIWDNPPKSKKEAEQRKKFAKDVQFFADEMNKGCPQAIVKGMQATMKKESRILRPDGSKYV